MGLTLLPVAHTDPPNTVQGAPALENEPASAHRSSPTSLCTHLTCWQSQHRQDLPSLLLLIPLPRRTFSTRQHLLPALSWRVSSGKPFLLSSPHPGTPVSLWSLSLHLLLCSINRRLCLHPSYVSSSPEPGAMSYSFSQDPVCVECEFSRRFWRLALQTLPR